MKKIYILWSGGWDGTFRLLQLCQYAITIQPVYVIDKDRNSYTYEMTAMRQIIEVARNNFVANILDPITYEKEWILKVCKNDEISRAFKKLRMNYAVGTQYEWFALLCDYTGLTMESAVVHQYHGKVENAIYGEGCLKILNDDVLPERYVVENDGDKNLAKVVFGDLILPVIKLSKIDEYNLAKENGWLDIMKLSWFCHTPIGGMPCGLCGPCDDAMNTGMEWRLDDKAKNRYRHKKSYLFLRKLLERIGRDL